MWSRIMENIIEVCSVNKYFGEEHVLRTFPTPLKKAKSTGS